MNKKIIVLGILIILFVSLLHLNSTLNKSTKKDNEKIIKKVVMKKNNISKNTTYSYGDIFESILSCNKLDIKNIIISKNNSCDLEVIYKGKAENLYDYLKNIKYDKNFYSIKNIKYTNSAEGVFVINIEFNHISEGKSLTSTNGVQLP